MNEKQIADLEQWAAAIRLNVLKMLTHCTYGHLGGSLSIVELLAVLYGEKMKYDPKDPTMQDRDYVVLSKGHAGPGLYSALAHAGFFDTDTLMTLNQNGTKLPSHPNRLKTPGVDATTGSLGQGTSVAAGLGVALKMENSPRNVHLIVGDGELNEGQCWEAFQFIAAHKLNNVIVYIDENKRQLDGYTDDILNPFDIVKKMQAFGFYTQRVKGDNVEAISKAINTAQNTQDQAVCIVLDTIKGQGVPYFEEMKDNHSVKFDDEGYAKAKEAIEKLEEQVG